MDESSENSKIEGSEIFEMNALYTLVDSEISNSDDGIIELLAIKWQYDTEQVKQMIKEELAHFCKQVSKHKGKRTAEGDGLSSWFSKQRYDKAIYLVTQ